MRVMLCIGRPFTSPSTTAHISPTPSTKKESSNSRTSVQRRGKIYHIVSTSECVCVFVCVSLLGKKLLTKNMMLASNDVVDVVEELLPA